MRDSAGGTVAPPRRLLAPAPERVVPRARRPLLALSSDERLARYAQRGDPHAFDLIFRRYQDELYRFCVGILREPQDAQDALQNTMVKAIRALPGEQREIQLRPWLYRIAHNEAVELHRRRRPADALETTLVDAGPGPADRADRDQRLEKLFEDIDDLPARQRAALVMRELNGLEFGEIGDALGTSAGAVRQALYEARRGLHEMKAGREMACAAITRALSDGDRRRVGRRQLRAHLRQCSECRRFKREIRDRRQAFAAISPLPIAVAFGLVKGAVAGSSGGGAAGIGSLVAGAAVKSTSLPGLIKGVAGVLAIAAIGTAADRSGVVHLPLDRSQPSPAKRAPAQAGAEDGPGPGGVQASPAKSHRVAASSSPQGSERGAAAVGRQFGAESEVSAGLRVPSRQPSGSAPRPRAAAVPANQVAAPPQGEEARQLREIAAPPGQSKSPAEIEAPGKPEHPAHPEHPEHPAHPAKAAETPPAEPAPPAVSPEPAAAPAEAQPEKGNASAPGQVKKQLSELLSEP